MSTWRFEIVVDVDDDALADHDGTNKPPPNDPAEWYGGDLEAAVAQELARTNSAPLPTDPADVARLARAAQIRVQLAALDVDPVQGLRALIPRRALAELRTAGSAQESCCVLAHSAC